MNELEYFRALLEDKSTNSIEKTIFDEEGWNGIVKVGIKSIVKVDIESKE